MENNFNEAVPLNQELEAPNTTQNCGNVSHASLAASAPVEILSIIFHLACQNGEDGCHPVLLSHVCKWWYAVAFQDPLLWNKIDISYPSVDPYPFERIIDKTEAYLSRSGESPLSVYLTLGHHPGTCQRQNLCMSCTQHIDKLIYLFGVLMGENRRNLSRITTLLLDNSRMSGLILKSTEGKELSLLQLMTSFSMPRIESLKLITTPGYDDRWYNIEIRSEPSWLISAIQEATSSVPKFPMLKELAIRGSVPLLQLGVELPNLRSLRLETDATEIPKSLLGHVNFMKIQELYLSGDYLRPYNSGVDFLPIIEQAVNVRTVTITPSLEEAARHALRDRIEVPEVTTTGSLRYNDYDDDYEEWECTLGVFDF